MGDQHECPTCDYTSDTQMGISVHHHKAHGESIAKGTFECDNCGGEFEEYHVNQKGKREYCSKECKDKHQATLPSEEQPAWKGGKATVECAMCGDEKQVKRYRLDRTDNFFCSDECYNQWRSINYYGKHHHDYKQVEIECEYCGIEYTEIPSRIERSEHNFCSHECHNHWMAEHQHGPNHHQWTGGRHDYGEGWNPEKRDAVRKRDGRECVECGLTEQESLDKYGRTLDVHHLIRPDSGIGPMVYNATHNLVTLCVTCHHQQEASIDNIRQPSILPEVSKV